MNYFSLLCFLWSFIALLSRFFIVKMGKEWNKWELEKAYTVSKPIWVNFVAVLGILLVIFTWYRVFTTTVSNSWVIALLITITLYKAFNLLFKYNKFRKFVVTTLNNTKKWNLINILITIFALALIAMGTFLY